MPVPAIRLNKYQLSNITKVHVQQLKILGPTHRVLTCAVIIIIVVLEKCFLQYQSKDLDESYLALVEWFKTKFYLKLFSRNPCSSPGLDKGVHSRPAEALFLSPMWARMKITAR